ncbi:MAG: cytochrome c [Sphingobacteriaceae bacterium]|nr:cytochrome c [Cytophagaceae bacterium]
MNYFLLLTGIVGWGWVFQKPVSTPIRTSAFASRLPADSGKVIYDTYCLACHQADGRGVAGQNPPLAKTDWVLGDKTRLIGVILNGLSEEMEINGEVYDNPMPAHDFLTDKQVAEVLTYVRSHFGNEGGAVRPEEVQVVRAKKK